MRTIVVLLLGVVAGACTYQTGVERDGKRFGVTKGVFHGRWWNYYERGNSYLTGEYYKEAEADLREALKARSEDSWQARTYGLHFVEYFPNRELGVVCFNTGRLDEAERLLKKSLGYVDTERAHHYMDLITKARLAKGEIKDPAPPVIETTAAPETVVATREVPVDVKIGDEVGVSKVVIDGQEVPQRSSEKQVVVKQKVLLKEGTHEIKIQATDLADKPAEKTVKVDVDLTGPNIGIYVPKDALVTDSALTRLEGVTVDKSGVASVALGDRMLADPKGQKKQTFTTELPLGDGENSFIVVAKDIAGNETRSAVKVFKGKPGSVAARLWLLEQKFPQTLKLASTQPPGMLSQFLLSAEQAAAKAPAEGITINVKSPDPGKPYHHNKTVCVSGEAVAGTKVASLSINGEPFEALTGAPKESFNRRIPVDAKEPDKGDAKVAITIVAKDDKGHESTKKVDVDVRPVRLDSRESKMPVAVLAFAGNGVDASLSDSLRLGAEAKLFDSNRFRVLDRTRLKDVLTEQQLASALANPNDAISLGKLTNAQVFLVADVFPRDKKGLEIKARAVSTETSDILATMDVFIDDKADAAKIDKGCKDLAAQLAKTFPRLSGELMAVRPMADGDEALVNWTKEDGIREGMYLIVVQESEPWKDPATGEVLAPGEMKEVGRAKIQSILGSGAKAKAIKREQDNVKLDKGMAAVTM